MSSTNQETKEIDLLELFSLIGKGIKNAFLGLLKAIVFLIAFGIKKAHWLAIIVVLGATTGYILFNNTSRVFVSGLIAQPNGIVASDLYENINDLNKYASNNNSDALSLALDLPDSTAKKIKSIESFYYLDINSDRHPDFVDFDNSFNPKDTSHHIMTNRIYIKVKVTDNKILPDVRDGLIKFIDKNPYLNKLNDLRKTELTELIQQTELEIIKLDSLQNVEYFKNDKRLSLDYKLLGITETDKPLYYIDKMKLILKKQDYQQELEFASSSITILKDFAQISVEEKTKGDFILLFGFWFGVGGYLLFFFLFFREKIVSFINS